LRRGSTSHCRRAQVSRIDVPDFLGLAEARGREKKPARFPWNVLVRLTSRNGNSRDRMELVIARQSEARIVGAPLQ
jgi:hypothetical protein